MRRGRPQTRTHRPAPPAPGFPARESPVAGGQYKQEDRGHAEERTQQLSASCETGHRLHVGRVKYKEEPRQHCDRFRQASFEQPPAHEIYQHAVEQVQQQVHGVDSRGPASGDCPVDGQTEQRQRFGSIRPDGFGPPGRRAEGFPIGKECPVGRVKGDAQDAGKHDQPGNDDQETRRPRHGLVEPHVPSEHRLGKLLVEFRVPRAFGQIFCGPGGLFV